MYGINRTPASRNRRRPPSITQPLVPSQRGTLTNTQSGEHDLRRARTCASSSTYTIVLGARRHTQTIRSDSTRATIHPRSTFQILLVWAQLVACRHRGKILTQLQKTKPCRSSSRPRCSGAASAPSASRDRQRDDPRAMKLTRHSCQCVMGASTPKWIVGRP
jgi:hypothetical protein